MIETKLMATKDLDYYQNPRAVQIFKFEAWCQPTSNGQAGQQRQQPPLPTAAANGNLRSAASGIGRDLKASVKSIGTGVKQMAITAYAGTRRPRFDRESLRKILLHDSVRNVRIVPICLAGPSRSGKSFLLNFMLRYLNALPNVDEEKWETKNAQVPVQETTAANGANVQQNVWLGDETAEAKDGFDWRSGSVSHTEGIWAWSRAIRVRQGGKDYAIVLLDTQGTFDKKASATETTIMLALSSLLSSVFIFNIRQVLSSDVLQHMQFFVEYGNAATGGSTRCNSSKDNPFQDLVFLLRDWQNPDDFHYGLSCKYRDEALNVNSADPDYCEETREIAQSLLDHFDTVECYLLPHPGEAITSKSFRGEMSKVGASFKQHLPALVNWIFAEHMTRVKQIGSQKLTCSKLCDFAISCVTMFENAGELPSASSIANAHWQAKNRLAIEAAVDAYNANMLSVTLKSSNRLSDVDFETLHSVAHGKSKDMLDGYKLFGMESVQNESLRIFENKITERQRFYAEINTLLRDYKAEAKTLKEDLKALEDKIAADVERQRQEKEAKDAADTKKSSWCVLM